MLVKIALALIVFWLMALAAPFEIGNVVYAFPPIAIIMIMVSGRQRRIKNPNDY
jgi:hypothetical protein